MLEQVLPTFINLLLLIHLFAVGFDRVIFSGNPTLKDLKNYAVKASPEEQGILFELGVRRGMLVT